MNLYQEIKKDIMKLILQSDGHTGEQYAYDMCIEVITKYECNICEGTGYDGHDRSVPPENYICEKCNGTGIRI